MFAAQRAFILTVILWLSFFAGGCSSVPKEHSVFSPVIRVGTYNVNYGNTAGSVVETLEKIDADVLCLQETERFEVEIRRGLSFKYPHTQFRNSETRDGGGYAFLSKYPMEEVKWVSSEDWFGGWIVAVQTPIGPVQVLNLHLHPPIQGRSFVRGYLFTRDDRLREVRLFHSNLPTGIPTIVAGDFNDTSHSRAVRFLKRRGFKEAAGLRGPTWKWRTRFITLWRRIDHLLYSSELACVEAKVERVGASDHFPVVGTFALTRPQ
jgi:endonuclease/exonuclease/phosphatase family metal-dependent hydrolase